MKTIAAVSVVVVCIGCGGYTQEYYPNAGYPHGDSNYPRGGGSRYPYPGPAYPFHDLDLPPTCNSMGCLVHACASDTCPNFPYARCVGFCDDCVARFFDRGVNVTPFCGGNNS